VVEDEYLVQLNAMAHLWHASVGAPTGWEEDNSRTEYHRKEANKAFRDVGRSRLPWYNQWAKNEGKELADLYAAFKAREKDPEYALHLKALRDKVNEKAARYWQEIKALESVRESIKQERTLKDLEMQRRRKRRAGLRR